MGTGNYWHEDGNTAIASPYDGLDIDDPDYEEECRWAWDDLKESILTAALATGTMRAAAPRDWRRDSSRSFSALILAEGDLYQVWLVEDSHGHAFITYGISEDIPDRMDGLARHHLDTRATAFFDRLEEEVDLRVATSAWTSAPRSPSSGAAMAA